MLDFMFSANINKLTTFSAPPCIEVDCAIFFNLLSNCPLNSLETNKKPNFLIISGKLSHHLFELIFSSRLLSVFFGMSVFRYGSRLWRMYCNTAMWINCFP